MNSILFEQETARLLYDIGDISIVRLSKKAFEEIGDPKNALNSLLSVGEEQLYRSISKYKNECNSFTRDIMNTHGVYPIINDMIAVRKKCINVYNAFDRNEESVFLSIVKSINTLIESYEQFLKSHSSVHAVEFISDLVYLWKDIAKLSLVNNYMLLVSGGNSQMETESESEIITIGLQSDVSNIDVISIKLKAIGDIYKETSTLMKYDSFECRLKIIKIETGSLWIKAVSKKAIGVIVIALLESASSFLFDKFYSDREFVLFGDMTVDDFESIVRIRDSLAKAGVDTSEIDGKLEKSLRVIARALDNAMQGEAEIRVNERVYSVRQEVKKEYLEYVAKKEIETKEVQDSRHD